MNTAADLQRKQTEFREFAAKSVEPHAADHDRSQRIAPRLIETLAEVGYLAPFLPEFHGGQAMDMETLGMLHEEMGRGCSSIRSLLTVHGMATETLWRWGSDKQRERWLDRLSAGEILGALALSEPNAGSDIDGIETTATVDFNGFLLNGSKKWMTFGQIAGLFLVLARTEDRPVAMFVERDTPGLEIVPIFDMFGTRGSMVAQLHFRDCFVPRENMIGRPGFGNAVVLAALSFGRYSVACGSLGIAQACLDASLKYVGKVSRFGSRLCDHQLIQQMITGMVTDTTASRLLCRAAGQMKDAKDSREVQQTFVAKYHASTAAMRAAEQAVQIHGANGCTPDYPVERYMRDAKVMEIIEGSTQIQQITIAQMELQEFERRQREALIEPTPTYVI